MYGVGQSGGSLGASPSGGIRLNFITPSDQAKFEDLFSRAAASTGSNKLPAMAVRDILTRSRVDNDSLAKIWDLSSIANAPYLTFPEFAIAMYLTSEKLRGKVVPATLPSAIREEVELAIATLASKEGSNPPISQPSMPQASFMPQQQQQQQQFMPQISQPQPQFPQQQQFGGGSMMQPQIPAMTGASPFPNMMNPSPMTTPPVQAPMRTGIAPPMYNDNKPRLAGQDFASKMMPNQAGGVVDLVTGRSTMPSATTWKISPEEKQRYRDIFTAWNGPGLTYMPGNTAREVLLQSNLSEQDLMRIWHLADRDNRGSLDADEFAIAMHLIYRKLNGVEVPSTLPAELAAPSSVLKKFVRGYQSSPTPPPMQRSPQQQQEYHPPVEDSHTGYVSNARRKGPASRFRSSVASRPRMQSYDEEEEEEEDGGYDNSAEIEELRFQIRGVKDQLDRLNASNARNQDTFSGDDNRYSVEELKDKIRKTQEELTRTSRSNPKYFENAETLLDLLETQKTLQDEIQYLCNRDIPVLARQLRGAVAELRDTKVRYGRKNDGSQDYMAFVEPTGPGGIVTESDRVRAKAKAMMAARKAGTSSSRDASYDLKKAEQEKEDYDRQADQYEREMERSRDALRDLRGELNYLSSLSESKAIKDKKRFDKGQDLSYELRRFVDQLERDSILGGTSSSSVSTPSTEPRYGSSSLSTGGPSLSPKPATAPTSPKPPAASTPPPSKPRTAEEIKKEAERRVQERLAALQAKRSPSARSPKPSPVASTPNDDELAAQRRLREVEQQAQQRLRESEMRQEEFSTPPTTPQDNLENERIRREQAEREQAEREKAEEERRIAEEKELEERRRAVLEKEEKQRLARLEAIQRAEDEREEERRREEEAALQKLQGSTPKAQEEPQQQPTSSAPPPPPPPPPAPPAPAASAASADANAKTSSNNPFAKLQQGKDEEGVKSEEQEKKPTEQPEEEEQQDEKPVNNKRVSYNPFAAFSAFSATKATGHDDSDSDDDGWDVVHHDDTDDENEFPAAGSAKNLAGMLFEAMSQRKSPMMPNRELGSASPKPPAAATADTSVPPPPPPPPSAPAAAAAAPPPPAPPAPPAAPPAPSPIAPSSTPAPEPSAGRSALLSQIQQGTKLRKAVTNDRSGASVAGHVREDTSSSSAAPAAPVPAPAPPQPAVTEAPAPSFPAPSSGFLAELQSRTTGTSAPAPPQEPSSPVKPEHHPEQPPAATSGDGKEYVTQWAYTGQSEDDLSFEQDETIIVLNDSDPDWWYGTHKSTGKTGYFPKAYVSVPGDKVRLPAKALYDFDGPEGEGCLSIQAGAELIILDKDADDWWQAEIPSTGKTGLVPANYVELD